MESAIKQIDCGRDIPSTFQPTAETSSINNNELSTIQMDWDRDGLPDEYYVDYNNDGFVDTAVEATYTFDDGGC